MFRASKSSVFIRKCRRGDLVHLAAIERSAAQLFGGTHAHAVVDGETTHPLTIRHAHRAGLLWVSEHDAALAGFLIAEPCPEGLYVRELSVARTAQRQGHGAALLGAAVAHAVSIGAAAVLLTTDRTLPWNAPFYARHGFVIIDGEAMPQTLRKRLAQQIADGMDPAHRCAMVLPC